MIIILLSVLIGMVLGTVACNMLERTSSPAMAQEAPAEAPSARELENEFTRIAEKTLPAVVRINVEATAATPAMEDVPERFREFFRQFPWFDFPEDEDGGEGGRRHMVPRRKGVGSGWIYSADGYIVTNAHVIADATKVTVVLHDDPDDGSEYPAEIVGRDPKTDLAVLKVDAGRELPYLKLGNSENMKVGSWVMAVGAPFQLEQTVTVGVVSAKGRLIEPDPSMPYIRLGDIIQTDASINPGNSGGPLVNLNGDVVGINVAYAAPMRTGNIGIGFAIPAETAERIVPRLMEGKPIARGWLGVKIKDLTQNLEEFYGVDGGARVAGIEADAPAADSDLQVDDIIIAVDGQDVQDTWDLQQAIAQREPGTTVTLTVVRNKTERKIKVKLGEMPAKYAGLPEEEPPAAGPEEDWPLGIAVMSLDELTPDIRRQLGIDAETARIMEDFTGVLVTDIEPDSRALPRVRPGDVISKVDGKDVATVEEYRKQMEKVLEEDRDFVVLHLSRVIDGEAVSDAVDVEIE